MGRRGRGGGRAAAATLLALSLLAAPRASADPLPQIRKGQRDTEALRRGFVGIVTGGPTGVYAALGNDLLRLLDDRKTQALRLGALMGSGSINNLDDLWNLPGVSLAIVQGDVLSAYAADPDQFRWLNNNLRYVSRLHTEVLHVIARRDALTPQQLFGWRRLARLGPSRCVERPLFVPVIVAPEPEPPRNEPPTPSKPRRRRRNEGASIELEIDGVVVRVGRDADAGAIAAVIGALKAGA